MKRSHAAVALASLVTERDFMRQVTDAAELYGWRWAHFRPAQRANGHWMTPVSGPIGVGFPDLVLTRERVLFVELKAEGASLRPPQRAVHESLRRAGAEVYTWRPSDLPTVLEILR
jgi:hypothetical protein